MRQKRVSQIHQQKKLIKAKAAQKSEHLAYKREVAVAKIMGKKMKARRAKLGAKRKTLSVAQKRATRALMKTNKHCKKIMKNLKHLKHKMAMLAGLADVLRMSVNEITL